MNTTTSHDMGSVFTMVFPWLVVSYKCHLALFSHFRNRLATHQLRTTAHLTNNNSHKMFN